MVLRGGLRWKRWSFALLRTSLVCVVLVPGLRAETGVEAWLRYAPLDARSAKRYQQLPERIVALDDSLVLRSAEQELIRGVGQMLGRPLRVEDASTKEVSSRLSPNPVRPQNGRTRGEHPLALPREAAVILGTLTELHSLDPALGPQQQIVDDAYWLKTVKIGGADRLVIAGKNDRGVLYGVFALLSKIARSEDIAALDEIEQPFAPIRWIDQWDNLDGRIERGYGGPSIFFAEGKVRSDLTRAGQYARLLASIGINACTVNNVNADVRVLDSSFIPQLSRIAGVFRPWGVQLSVSVDLSSPKAIGGLDTFDPLDARVAEWWRKKADEIYHQIPDFAGFVVKADSEGRVGPSAYGRSHANAANVLARALKPHGGVVFYRAFVYNHHLDWRDLKNDRAKAAYDNFHPLDGDFDDNAIVQIKNGPIDFQVREPASPLFAGLHRTNEAIELQVTQEYTGQQRQLCFLVPMWKEVLDFDMRIDDRQIDDRQIDGRATPVKDLVAGRTFHRPTGGFVGVANVGMDANWIGSPLAMANLYGFGRLAWNPNLSAESIVDEWTRLTFGSDPLVVRTIAAMQLASWHVYESYTGPLGAGTLTNIVGNHYDPGPESSEENGWGQWHRADHTGIGMDRTVATGTGFIGQYPPGVQKLYESLAVCPDNLLLFFHHVPYTYVLHSGKTVVQHIYDSHYEGAERARYFVEQWKTLEGHIDDERYRDILARFEYQAGQAIVWRDAISKWIYSLSGIADDQGRVPSDSATTPH